MKPVKCPELQTYEGIVESIKIRMKTCYIVYCFHYVLFVGRLHTEGKLMRGHYASEQTATWNT